MRVSSAFPQAHLHVREWDTTVLQSVAVRLDVCKNARLARHIETAGPGSWPTPLRAEQIAMAPSQPARRGTPAPHLPMSDLLSMQSRSTCARQEVGHAAEEAESGSGSDSDSDAPAARPQRESVKIVLGCGRRRSSSVSKVAARWGISTDDAIELMATFELAQNGGKDVAEDLVQHDKNCQELRVRNKLRNAQPARPPRAAGQRPRTQARSCPAPRPNGAARRRRRTGGRPPCAAAPAPRRPPPRLRGPWTHGGRGG